MELVSGSPITRYCDEHQLSTRDRLALIVEVSRAVQHALKKRDHPSRPQALEYSRRRAGRAGGLDTELKYVRQGGEAARRVYPEGHQYRKDSFRDLVRVLEQQAATFLERAWSVRMRAEEAAPLAAQARERLAELKAFGSAQSEVKVGGPWLECLRGFALVAAGERNAAAESLIVEGQRALMAIEKPSAEEKKRAEKVGEFLARAREIQRTAKEGE